MRRLTRRRLVTLGVVGAVAGFGERIGTPLAAVAQADGIVLEDGRVYDAYVPAVLKEGQFDQYTCEFDAAWVIPKTFGLDTTLRCTRATTRAVTWPAPPGRRTDSRSSRSMTGRGSRPRSTGAPSSG